MAVYVDNYYETGVRYRGMKMCHMIADTKEELLKMADAIGVQRKWLQNPGTCNEHFDICYSKRVKAISLGAKEINFRQYAQEIQNRAKKHGIHWARASVDLINSQKRNK
jgi:hypothetical protein